MAYGWVEPTARLPRMHDNYKIVEKGTMNKDGKLIDVTGNPLAVGNQVKVVEGYECCTTPHGIGTVMVLHESGDWVGYASVRWRDGGVSCSVPDKCLKIVARKATGIDPKELLAFALWLWNEGKSYAKDDIPDMVARYVVARVEVDDQAGKFVKDMTEREQVEALGFRIEDWS